MAQRKPLPPHLSRETVVHEPTIICACHGCDRAKLARLGEDVTEVLEKIPARLKVIRHVRPRYACRTCEAVFQAPAPELPIERGRPGPGLIANVAVSKFCDGLPLYRQSVILAREGIEIDCANWLRMKLTAGLQKAHAKPFCSWWNKSAQATSRSRISTGGSWRPPRPVRHVRGSSRCPALDRLLRPR